MHRILRSLALALAAHGLCRAAPIAVSSYTYDANPPGPYFNLDATRVRLKDGVIPSPADFIAALNDGGHVGFGGATPNPRITFDLGARYDLDTIALSFWNDSVNYQGLRDNLGDRLWISVSADNSIYSPEVEYRPFTGTLGQEVTSSMNVSGMTGRYVRLRIANPVGYPVDPNPMANGSRFFNLSEVALSGTLVPLPSHTLTYTAGSNGSIAGTSPQSVVEGTDGTAVTAVADSGYRFSMWSDNSTANPRTDLAVTTDITVTANFVFQVGFIENGSFETGDPAPAPHVQVSAGDSANLPGWTASANMGWYVLASGWNMTAPDGARFFNLNSETGVNTLSQTFAVTAGTEYTVSYSEKKRGTSGYMDATLSVADGTVTGAAGSPVAVSAGPAPGIVQTTAINNAWTPHSFTFTPSADTTATITFGNDYIDGNHGDNDGVFLDNVSVTADGSGLTATTTTLAANTNTTPSTFGDSLSFDVTVSGDSGTPTGTVTLKDGGSSGTVLGSATLASGACTITTTTLAVGAHANIVAVYGGDATYAGSISDALTPGQTVTPPATCTLTYTAGSNGSIAGELSQTVAYGADGTPVTAVADSGYLFVNWSDSSTANPRTDLAVTTDIDVTANFAVESTNLDLASATGVMLADTVAGGDGTLANTTWPTPNSYSSTTGNPWSNLTDGDWNHEGATKWLGAGTDGWGVYPGTAGMGAGFYFTLSAAANIQTIQFFTEDSATNRSPATMTIEGSNATGGDLMTGTNWTLIYTGTAGLATTANFSAGETVSFTNPTAYTSYRVLFPETLGAEPGGVQLADIVATTTGAAVGAEPSTTVLATNTNPNPSTYGASLNFDVTVSGSAGTPTGTVTLKDGGSSGTVLGSATLTGGACTITTSTLTVGSHPNIVAVYGGDATYAGSESGALNPAQTVNNNVATVTQSHDFNAGSLYNGTATNIELVSSGFFSTNMQPFNPALGTLQSFTVKWENISGTLAGTVGPVGSGSASGSFGGTFTLTGSPYDSNGGGNGGGNGPGLPLEVIFPGTGPIVSDQTFTVANAGVTYDPAILAAVTGTSPFAVAFDSAATVSSTNVVNLAASVTGKVTLTYTYVPAPHQTYATWATNNGFDPDHPEAVGNDGLTNLMIYALDLKTDGTNGSPGTLTGNLLSFTKRAEAVTNNDVSYRIEESDDLGLTDPWSEVLTYDSNDNATISYTLPTGMPASFARLRVTKP